MKGSHLTIEMADHSARFISFINEVVVNSSEITFDSQAEGVQKNQLRLQFELESFLQGEFDEVTLSWSTRRSTLVPTNIFGESSAKAIFDLCYGNAATEHPVDYNRIAELGLVNVFELPFWVKQFFVSKFPRIIIQHEGSYLLRKIMRSSTSKLKVTVILYHEYFQLVIDKQRNLEFYSIFDYQAYEDVIYHVLFTLQQEKAKAFDPALSQESYHDNAEGTLEVISGQGASTTVKDEILTNLTKIDDFKKFVASSPDDFIAQSHWLCV